MTNTAARLDLRLNPADKARIVRAAVLRGMPVSAFVRDAVLREADATIGAESIITLSPAESRRLLAALDKPFKLNARLKKAMERGLAIAIVVDEPPRGEIARPTQARSASLAASLRGRATARMSTDQIMQLTRGA